MILLVGGGGQAVHRSWMGERLVLAGESRGGYLSDHETGVEAAFFDQEGRQLRHMGIDQQGHPPLGQRPDFGDGERQVVGGHGHRFGGEGAAGHDQALDPAGVRRWFKKNYNMTFHNYVRKIRLSNAITEMKNGETMTQAAFAQGYESLSGFIDAMKSFTGKTPTESKNVKFLSVDKINTQLGPMIACAMDDGIYLLEFEDRRMLKTQMKRIIRGNKVVPVLSKHKYIKQIEEELQLYFEGKLSEFKTPFKMTGTEFQKSVWNQLLKIPFGETICYEELAARIGNPTAQRAVANANGFNSIGIVIPCHRVIGKDGNLRGYGGKVWRKKKLLDLESANNNAD